MSRRLIGRSSATGSSPAIGQRTALGFGYQRSHLPGARLSVRAIGFGYPLWDHAADFTAGDRSRRPQPQAAREAEDRVR